MWFLYSITNAIGFLLVFIIAINILLISMIIQGNFCFEIAVFTIYIDYMIWIMIYTEYKNNNGDDKK